MNPLRWDEDIELNITPLVDIMLVLLAILMVTAPVVVYQENITLPQGSKTNQVLQDSKIEIRIDLQRKIYLRDQIYSYENFADNFVLSTHAYDKNTPVFIRADKDLKYDDVIFILKTAKNAGFLKVSLITDG